MPLLQDFKKFALKGNVLDLAVAVVIGAAFAKIVSSVVEFILMPVFAAVLPGGNWREFTLTPLNLKVGALVGATVDLFIISFFLFLVVKLAARLQPAELTTRECPKCLENIPRKATRCRACTSDVEPA
jgi:large conductance mechanosensitive channel